MSRKVSLVVFFILLSGGCVMLTSNHHETPKPVSPRYHDAAQHDCAACHVLSKAEAQTLLKNFGEVKDVKPAPVKGLYEVTIQQGNQQAAAYVDFSKQLILAGRMYTIATRKLMTPQPTAVPVKLSKAQMGRIKLENSIIMGNENGGKRMFVFTDPDCPYCKRLHGELKSLVSMQPDLAIYIKMYPMKMHHGAYDKARVILAARSLDYLDKAFAGGKLPPPSEKDRKESVDETIRLAQSLGIRGTPALVLPDGRLIIGFRNAENLKALLTPQPNGMPNPPK